MLYFFCYIKVSSYILLIKQCTFSIHFLIFFFNYSSYVESIYKKNRVFKQVLFKKKKIKTI